MLLLVKMMFEGERRREREVEVCPLLHLQLTHLPPLQLMNEEMTSLLHHQIISPFLNHSLVYVLGVDPRGGGVSAVATQPLVLGMDTYAAPLMRFAHVQFLKFTPHLFRTQTAIQGQETIIRALAPCTTTCT